jgi:hypothetical protein
MKLFALSVLVVLPAFAQKVDFEFDQQTDFAKFKTFAIRDGRLNSKDPMLNSELIRKRLDTDIQKALEAKGLAFASSGPADLNVRYTLGAVQKREVERYPAGWRGMGTRTVRVPYTAGTLVIDLRDSGTRTLVWRAVAHEESREAAKIEHRLDDMVKKAISKYPPKTKQ